MEWTIVTVLIAVIGLIATVTTPLIKLNGTITKLNSSIEEIQRRTDRNEADNHASHSRIWQHNEEQDKQIVDHEQRIGILEHDHDRFHPNRGDKNGL